ncbi:DUF2909 family protein [Gallaecimonas kandeliae]|uniref:DUF2909 family protein n=1 Tax=Gallaecimonas kandeliae TaxID=3029055 RepID=UPI00264871D0|nr:DUF2909 family protein [Gallaecimonas kandeliae]WKE65837.1 DUF2909 family protein [Gallaecimonas kandeliae]
MLIKLLIVLLLAVVIFNLFRALFSMLRQGEEGQMSKHLGRRLLFSALVLALIILLLVTGVIVPHHRPY